MTFTLNRYKQGYVNAENNLGVMYQDANGVAANEVEALKWFTKAAEQGFPEAQKNLGAMFEKGIGVPKDYVQAAKWYSLAVAQANEGAVDKYLELAKIMTPEQVAQAQKMIKDFLAHDSSQ